MWTSYKQLNLSDSLVWGGLRLCAVTLSTGSPAVRFRGSTEGMARSMSWVTLCSPAHSYPWKVSEIQHRHSNGLGRDHGAREKRHGHPNHKKALCYWLLSYSSCAFENFLFMGIRTQGRRLACTKLVSNLSTLTARSSASARESLATSRAWASVSVHLQQASWCLLRFPYQIFSISSSSSLPLSALLHWARAFW